MSTATLTQAAHDRDRAGVTALLAEGSNPNETDGRGWTPLLYGVLAGDPAIVDALIRAGADVNGAAPDGATPLIKAAMWGHIEIVQALLNARADPQRRDGGGWSALDLAEAGHGAEVAHLLRAACARMEIDQARSTIAESDASS
jgi:ankyrin repeat protein